ncbi:MAG: primosomal replication protein N, partial [Rhodoferax sp.]
GQVRHVKVAIKAVAFGAMAERLCQQIIGSVWVFTGFLANARGGKQVVLHILDIQPA